ncbi:hypothetical protein H0N99_03080 [Candidatus Micrarchaeota archaeon]|nr:hypothetical protein [Candidatus Micrarchaeota archaeon]
MASRGQEATELIVLLAMITVAGLVIYSTSQTNLAQFQRTLIISQAKATVNDLSSAASEVYSEGAGAMRKVYITIPEGVDSSGVYVNNTMINVRVLSSSGTTDINTQTSMRVVQGADFPTTPGSYWVYVTAKQGYVLIGRSYVSINPSSLSISMPQSNSTSSVISFTDIGTFPVAVILSTQWSYGGTVDVTLDTTYFVLFPSGTQNTINVLVTAQTYSNTSLKSYSGSILVNTNTTETYTINLNVNVIGTQVPTGVSYIVVDTFRNSSYFTPSTNFTLPRIVNINGSGWTAGAVTLNITNSSGSSVSGYPTTVQANQSGYFNTTWNPSGNPLGNYTLGANQSGTTNSTSFNITACP